MDARNLGQRLCELFESDYMSYLDNYDEVRELLERVPEDERYEVVNHRDDEVSGRTLGNRSHPDTLGRKVSTPHGGGVQSTRSG